MLVTPNAALTLRFESIAHGKFALASCTAFASASREQMTPITARFCSHLLWKSFICETYFLDAMLVGDQNVARINLPSNAGFVPIHLSTSKGGAAFPRSDLSEIDSARISRSAGSAVGCAALSACAAAALATAL